MKERFIRWKLLIFILFMIVGDWSDKNIKHIRVIIFNGENQKYSNSYLIKIKVKINAIILNERNIELFLGV